MIRNERYRVLTLSRGTVLCPLSIPRVEGGMWLYGAVHPVMVRLQMLNGLLVGQSIRLTPGRNVEWSPPVPRDRLEDCLAEVEDLVKQRIIAGVIQLPGDRRRRRFGLLLLNEQYEPVAFAKFTMNPPNTIALAAMRRFGENPPNRFWAPHLLTEGVLGEYSFMVTSTMPNRPHSPARLSPQARFELIGDIQGRLSDLVHGTQIMHGDFGAWNVRSFRDKSLAIIDWEEAGRGVPAADELWHALSWYRSSSDETAIAQSIEDQLQHHGSEVIGAAARFWLGRLGQPEPREVDPEVGMPGRLQDASTGTLVVLERLARLTAP